MPPGKRPQTHDDRDVRRKHTAPRGIGLTEPPQFISEEVTGRVQGDELRVARAGRTNTARIERLEDKHDTLVATVGDLAKDQIALTGSVKSLIKTIEDDATERREDRKFWRAVKLKIAGGVFSGGVILAVAHRMGWL